MSDDFIASDKFLNLNNSNQDIQHNFKIIILNDWMNILELYKQYRLSVLKKQANLRIINAVVVELESLIFKLETELIKKDYKPNLLLNRLDLSELTFEEVEPNINKVLSDLKMFLTTDLELLNITNDKVLI